MKYRPTRLVVQHLEGVAGEVLDKSPEVIRDFIRGKNGVYALYRDGRLYYVGLARNLRSRLRSHMRDRHSEKWNRFSIYLTESDEHLKELEALILRIAEPPGNRVTGKFIDSQDLRYELRRRLRESEKRKIEKWTSWSISDEGESKLRINNKGKLTDDKHKTKLSKYVLKRLQIRIEYKGKTFIAHIRKDGTITFDSRSADWQRLKNKIFNSPSSAGKAATGRSINGWTGWRFKTKDGSWISLDALRKGRVKLA